MVGAISYCEDHYKLSTYAYNETHRDEFCYAYHAITSLISVRYSRKVFAVVRWNQAGCDCVQCE